MVESGSTIRIDKLLWYVRLYKSRSLAQKIVVQGHIRLNGRRANKANCPVRVGDRLTLPVGREIRAIELRRIPVRRGPAAEALSCYVELIAGKP